MKIKYITLYELIIYIIMFLNLKEIKVKITTVVKNLLIYWKD